MNIVTVVGARPPVIKATVVSAALAERAGIVERIVHTGQHYDANMSDVFFEELGIPRPSVHLDVRSGPHGAQTGQMLAGIEAVLLEQRPDAVLVYGDTNSTAAGALAASKLHIPVAHVEAGLRSFNRRMPEEQNRVITDHLADVLFAPTDLAVANLAHEGIVDGVHAVGDVMYDVALHFAGRARTSSVLLDRLGLIAGAYVLMTVHRAENTDEPARLRAIVDGATAVADTLTVVLPMHPRTVRTLADLGITMPPGVRVIEPVGYLDMVALEVGAEVIVTDSGGVQKEAFFHGVPCITLRDETEWVELIELGWNELVPPVDATAIARAVLSARGRRGRTAKPYGDGHAAVRIADVMEKLGS